VPRTTYSTIWCEARAKVGLPELRFHDLRHFHATWLLDQGASDMDVAIQLGHRDGGVQVRRTYGHPSRERALARLRRCHGRWRRESSPGECIEGEAWPAAAAGVSCGVQRARAAGADGDRVRIVAAVPGFGLDRWALVGDKPAPMLSPAELEEEYDDPSEQEIGSRFVAAFGVPWTTLDDRRLGRQLLLWDAPAIRGWLSDPETTCEQLLELRRYTGDRPSVATRALLIVLRVQARSVSSERVRGGVDAVAYG
jgi:hypothetical protein